MYPYLERIKKWFLKLFKAITLISCACSSAYSQETLTGHPITASRSAVKSTQELHTHHALKPLLKDASAMTHHAKAKPFKNFPLRLGFNFTGATVSNAPQTVVIPLNATGWVGNQQYILMSYQAVRSFNKFSGLPDGILDTDAASFFGTNASDVRIEYDRFSRRWFATAEVPGTTNAGNDLSLAISRDSTITTTTQWDFYTFTNVQLVPQITNPGNGFLDYGQLAIDQEAVYVSLNTFDSLGNFAGGSTLVLPKESLLSGSSRGTVFYGLFPEQNPNLGYFIPPADNFDKQPRFGYLIHASIQGYPSNTTYTSLYLYRIENQGTAHPALTGPIAITVPAYAGPGNAPHKGNLYGSRGDLQTGLFGGLMAPHVRNKQLFACHPIQLDLTGHANPDGDRVGVRWYQFDLTGELLGTGDGREQSDTVPVLVQYGTLYDANTATSTPKSYYIPSIMTNKKLDLVISATVSGADDFTNVAAACRKKHDPSGTLSSPILLTNNFSNTYNFGPLANPLNGNIGQRWGDESSLAPDPVNDLDIWSTGQWAAVQNGWGVQVTQLIHGKPHPRIVVQESD